MAVDRAKDDAQWPAGAECLIKSETVSGALDALAERIAGLITTGESVSLVALMKGGMYPAIHLARRLPMALKIDYVHATRYRGETSGGEIRWAHWPDDVDFADHIILIDDIFDEGYTMAAVADRLRAESRSKVTAVVLAVKQHERGMPRDWVDDHALTVPDRYVFGCGMDLHGYWRQLDEIWAVPA